MEYEWDPIKAISNIDKHGVRFELVFSCDWSTALEEQDEKHSSEVRVIALGLLEGRLQTLVYTMRESVCRIISLRKANNQEMEKYEQAQIKAQFGRGKPKNQ
jgi:uncharacterized DUF497 family protein